MAKDLNKVMLTGRLGADPEMRYTPQGSMVTNFVVASNRTWKSSDGSSHDSTEWFRVTAWDKLGAMCNDLLSKGTRVYVEGRLQTRKWQDKEGNDRYTTEVVASELIILSRKSDRSERQTAHDGDDALDHRLVTSASPARTVEQNGHGAPRRQPTRMHDWEDDVPF